jgi:hypothetical protein
VGYNLYGQLNVSSWTDITAIAAGYWHTVGLKEDGRVVAVGYNDYGQLNTFDWSNVRQPVTLDCDGDGYTVDEGDCDDNDASINPGAAEVVDCIDNDCDGLVDEGDVTLPAGTISVSQNYIWPPNHEMVPITVDVSGVTDVNLKTVIITEITSSEPDNGLGDGDTTGDTAITGDLTGAVRAERSGKGTGRTYTVTVTATDCAGNETDFTAEVFVPHDRRK